MELKIQDDVNDIKCQKKCGLFFNWKRFFLPLAIILPILIIFEKLQNDFYIFISCLVSSFILTWNFPYFSKFGYTKPIYFEDLEQEKINYNKVIKNKIISNIENSTKFQNRFLFFQQIILSVTLALIIDYSTHRYKDTQLVFTEILGLLGGLVTLYLKITQIIGKIILKLLYKDMKKERHHIIEELRNKSSLLDYYTMPIRKCSSETAIDELKFNNDLD